MGWGLKRLVSQYSGRPRRYSECRRCGTTIDDESEGCPCCDADAIVTYDL